VKDDFAGKWLDFLDFFFSETRNSKPQPATDYSCHSPAFSLVHAAIAKVIQSESKLGCGHNILKGKIFLAYLSIIVIKSNAEC
jgi:hypothetical protein